MPRVLTDGIMRWLDDIDGAGRKVADILEHARSTLEQGGYEITEVRELSTGHGWHLRCTGGEILCVYRTGKLVPQGRNAKSVKALFDAALPLPTPPRRAAALPVTSPPRDNPVAADAGPRKPSNWSDEPWDGVTIPF